MQLVEPDTGNYTSPPAVSRKPSVQPSAHSQCHPSTPPLTSETSIAVGALWASADGNGLYLWGGQFQDTPSVPPPPARTYRYDIQKGDWTVVQTEGDEIGAAAEGQPAIVPLLGEDGDNIGYCKFLRRGFGSVTFGFRLSL